jgi:hypothetical protein
MNVKFAAPTRNVLYVENPAPAAQTGEAPR